MKFSDIEVQHLVRAWAAISFAFAIVLGGGIHTNFGLVFLLSALTVGVSFITHELAHKFVAQRYGCWAEFRSYDAGLVLAILMAMLTGFVFAAPGAVMIAGLVTTEENGKIAAAGPITNLALALSFYLISLLLPFGSFSWLSLLVAYGYTVNSWLAFFNLIPFGPLDGLKIMNWSKPAWILLLVVAGYLTFFGPI